MIARFRIVLPFEIVMAHEVELPPHEFKREPYEVKIYPPCRAAFDSNLVSLNNASLQTINSVPLSALFDLVRPDDSPPLIDGFHMGDAPAVLANLIQLDFLKEEFDRRRSPLTDDPTAGDPPIQLAFDLTNRFLSRLRALLRAGHIKPVEPGKTFWRLDYLDADGQPLSPTPELIAGRRFAVINVRVCGIHSATWEQARELPEDFEAPVWDALLLDAEALLPEVGPAIVVAATALETFITWCLDKLATTVVKPEGLWDWVNKRDHWQQEPSTGEQFDSLLRLLTGKSLKDDNKQLWEAFQNLRNARNNYAHEGKPRVGKRASGEAITVMRAAQLVAQAKEIVAWVEQLLPETDRRPQSRNGSPLSIPYWHDTLPAE